METEKDQIDNLPKSYLHFVFQIVKKPDTIITEEYKGLAKYGATTIIMLLILIFLSNLVKGISSASNEIWYLVYLQDSIIQTVSFAIPLMLAIFLLNWIATEVIHRQSIAYYLEKVGSVLLLPVLVLLLSTMLKIYEIALYSWLNSLAYTLIYLGVFTASYLFSARHNYKIALLIVLGFYFLAKFISIIF